MSGRRIGVAAILAATLLALPGTAWGASVNRNSCLYSYDDYWRDMDVTIDGTASGSSSIVLDGQSVDAALPEWLAQYGYNLEILHAGRNEIPVRVWLAVLGVNTAEGVQVHEFETTAETEITVAGGAFVSATPIEYSVPLLPPLTWTARGGPVEFRQAGSGTLGMRPVGPGGRMQQTRGSLYISASLGQATLGLDCVPGTFIAQGAERVEATATPFAGVDAPALSCISGLPADGARLEMLGERVLAVAYSGRAYSYAPAVSYRLGNAYLRSLFDAGGLALGDNAVALTFASAVDGGGARAVLSAPPTTPATVRVSDGGATIRVYTASGSSIVEAADLAGAARLSAWSGLPGAGPLGFANAGSLGALNVEGVGMPVRPYGSLYARVSITRPGGAVNRLSLDCVSGRVTVSGAVPYSELGDQEGGDRGRYTIAPYTLDPFALAYTEPAVTPRETPTPVPTVGASPTPVPAVVPTVVPKPAERAALSVRSTKLKVSGSRVSVSLSCSGATCRGKVSLRTTAKRPVVLTRTSSYSARPGQRVNVRLSLSKQGRSLVKAKRRLSVVLVVKGTPNMSRRLVVAR